MSFEAAAWAIRRRTKTPTAKLVLIALADCHNADTGQCDPGNTYLADLAQCTKRSVINAIEELESFGYIATQKSNGRRTNYQLNLHVKQCNKFTGEKIAPVKSVHEPVKSETPTGENDNTSFSIQPVRTNKKTSESLADSLDISLAKFILAGICRLKPNLRKPNLKTWADDCRKMRELDNRTPDQIRAVFAWANSDDFWQANILSPAKLREKFDQLELQARRKGNQHEDRQPSTGNRLQQFHDQINAAAARAASRATASGSVEAHDTAVRPQVVIAAPTSGQR